VAPVPIIKKEERIVDAPSESCRQLIARMRRAIVQDKLCRLNRAAKLLLANPKNAARIVARLNNAFEFSSLAIRWLPGSLNQSDKLIIRNGSVALIVQSAPEANSEGKMLVSDRLAIRSLTPEAALHVLSAQMRRTMSKNSGTGQPPVLGGKRHLRALPTALITSK